MLTCLISDARVQYAAAQTNAEYAPAETVLVLTYRHKWVSPAAVFKEGQLVRLTVPDGDDNEYGVGARTVRVGILLGFNTSDVGIHLTVQLGETSPYSEADSFMHYAPQYFVFNTNY